MSQTTNDPRVAPGRSFISYMDLSGGLNTKRDVHALERNELAISQNAWYGTENAVSKRPGTAAWGSSTGATGTSLAGSGIVAARFANISYVVAQNSTALTYSVATASASTVYTSIPNGTSGGITTGASRIHAAQMYDPTTPTSSAADGSLIICDGKDVPQVWRGPGTSLVPVNTSTGFLPFNFTSTGHITPRFVIADGQNSNIVYAGEPTFPGAVYVSDPFFPEQFSFSATNTSSYPGTYSPYLIGQSDGVAGGDISGLAKLGTTIVITKQAAIYFMQLQAVYGNLVFTDYCVSASTGNVAPESLVAFDQFVCFLGNDGVYTCDIYGNLQQITRNVPTFFDNTLTGFAAICMNPTTAVGVRDGSRYLLFYDSTNVGYPNRGLWFDFAKPDKDGLPTVGEILGYNLAGAVQLKGPTDDGNFVWTDATQDRIGKFGIGFSDFGANIPVTLNLKADTLGEEYGPKGPVAIKALVNMWLDLAIPQFSNGAALAFSGLVTTDYQTQLQTPAQTVTTVNNGIAYYGQAHYGQDHYTNSIGSNTQYITARVTGLQAAQGRTLQLGLYESSVYPWTLIGITGEFNDKDVPGS